MPPTDAPGPLIGAGRTADVFALGPDRVVRRYRTDRDTQREAGLMTYLAQAGYPVPRVYDSSGPDLVMERIQGRDMLADLGRRPWLVRRHARSLAALHDRLHQIPAPPGLRERYGSGDRVVHLDLHPGNVMLTPSGPVVIDWDGAASGTPAVDVAMVWVIIASSDVDVLPRGQRPAAQTLRSVLLRQFLAAVHDDPAPVLARVARARMDDPHVRPGEIRRLEEIAARAERQAAVS
jgi:aminoglycoside phosphotransferase (APT) family kinase protein